MKHAHKHNFLYRFDPSSILSHMPLFFVNAVNSSEAAVLGNTFGSLADMKNERNLNFLPRHVQRATIIQKLLDEAGKR